MNRLKNMRCYLGGAIEFADQCGVEWRQQLMNSFDDFGIIWLDPTNKPIDIGYEDIENHKRRRELKRRGEFEQVSKEMRLVRCVDLRMIDLSDFLIFNIDIDTYTTGTIEELTTANRQKKPIIVRIKQGKCNCPDWILGMIPHEMIFSCFEEICDYLKEVSVSDKTYKRWFFFDFHGGSPDTKELDAKSLRSKELESWGRGLRSWEERLASWEKRLEKETKDLDKEKERLDVEVILQTERLDIRERRIDEVLGVRGRSLDRQEEFLVIRERDLDIREAQLEAF